MRWILPDPADPGLCRTLAEKLGVPRFVAELLCRRGFDVGWKTERGFSIRSSSRSAIPFSCRRWTPPSRGSSRRSTSETHRALRRLRCGWRHLAHALRAGAAASFGAEPRCFLPLRADEGYGLSADGVARCVSEHAPQLLVAVDCGTSSVAEIAALRAQGVDVLVFDHHEPQGGALPDCTALVNPKLGDGFPLPVQRRPRLQSLPRAAQAPPGGRLRSP